MKKGLIYEGIVEDLKFPNKGIVASCRQMKACDDGTAVRCGEALSEACRVTVKNTIPGQTVCFAVRKKHGEKAEGRLIKVLEKSPIESAANACPHFGICGGCNYQTLPYEEQLRIKERQVKELLKDAADIFEGIKPSPRQYGYRNKMEFTFGDEYKDGPLALGMHKRGSNYDIANVNHCRIVDEDYRRILTATADYFRNQQVPFYHRMRHEGYLRHLLVRKAAKTGEILIDIITTTQTGTLKGSAGDGKDSLKPSEEELLDGWKDRVLSLALDGTVAGILHTSNDSMSDAVKNEGTQILYGQDFFFEELLGLKFRITPFSFFQTNSSGAEVLYDTVRSFIRDSLKADGQTLEGRTVFDLYSGTGTIAQMLAPVAGKVIGVEIVEEAAEAAKENARLNGLNNCEFIAGDVLKILDELSEKPGIIVLDPPRDGVHPKALGKIVSCGAEKIIYISCKPTSLKRDLEVIQKSGYSAERICCVDMFPGTVHVETVCLLSKLKTRQHIEADLDEVDIVVSDGKLPEATNNIYNLRRHENGKIVRQDDF